MAMPSSPPLLAQDLPSSPPLPPTDHFTLPTNRKRYHSDYDSLSSDPLFSEDASEADSYTGVRKKKMYKGPWWRHGLAAGQPRAGREKSKVSDSGVWLPSEASEDSMSQDEVSNDPSFPPPASAVPYASRARDETRNLKAVLTYSAEELAERIVWDCVDNGDEAVDLSDMSLKHFSASTIRPLHQLILSKAMDGGDGRAFVSLTPDLRVFLNGNGLIALPAELWTLENIVVLSLRNNRIGELSGAIGNLKRLKELNFAGNDIQWLPWELLQLIQERPGHILRLITHPNPIIQPVDADFLRAQPPTALKNVRQVQMLIEKLHSFEQNAGSSDALVYSSMLRRVAATWLRRQDSVVGSVMRPIFAASGEIAYFDIDGHPLRKTATSFSSNHDEPSHAALLEHPEAPPTDIVSNAPSLFELAARSCRQSPYLQQFPCLLPLDAPDRITSIVDHALNDSRTALPRCSVCYKSYVVPRAEWMEYWHCNMSETSMPAHLAFLPFLRKACSWGCVNMVLQERKDNDDMSRTALSGFSC